MTIYFRKPLEGIDRPQMESDVTIVGGGPAGLACALRLSQLIDRHNRRNPEAPLSKENINVLEKARELGQHSLSGALLDPRSMDELLPGWREEEHTSELQSHHDLVCRLLLEKKKKKKASINKQNKKKKKTKKNKKTQKI